MLEHVRVAQRFAEDAGRLLDDRRVGDDVYHPAQAVGDGMIEREGEAGKRLAAAGRHRHREQAGRQCGLAACVRQDFRAQSIQRGASGGGRQFRHVDIEACAERLDRPMTATLDLLASRLRIELLGREEVRIDQAGKEHASEEG